jgi:hypothetical protein
MPPLEIKIPDAGGCGTLWHLSQQLIQGGEGVTGEVRVQLEQVARLWIQNIVKKKMLKSKTRVNNNVNLVCFSKKSIS